MWCPFAVHRPLPENSQQGSIVPRAVILHTAVSGASSLYNYFLTGTNLESHFYVNDEGTIEQYISTTVRADANLDANAFAISIETSDNREIRPWNSKQIESIVRLVDWICTVHNIPRVQIPKWDGAGIGWHVMFGAPSHWTPVNKSCPGAPRIEQTKNIIIPRVAQGKIEDEMQEQDFARIESIVKNILAGEWRFDGRNPVDMWRETTRQSLSSSAKLDALHGTLTQTEADIIAAVRADVNDTVDVAALAAALVEALPASITADQVSDAVRLAFAKAGSK